MLNTLYRYRASRHDENTEVGFTLIELLIVIVVLGILAAVTVFALSGTTKKSAAAACDADAATVNTAISAFSNANPGVAPTFTNLLATALGGPYLSVQPSNSHYTIGITTTTPYTATVAPASGTGPVNWPAASGSADPCIAAAA